MTNTMRAGAAAADLGFAYGVSNLRPSADAEGSPESASFLRIWKKSADGRWEIVLALFSPIK